MMPLSDSKRIEKDRSQLKINSAAKQEIIRNKFSRSECSDSELWNVYSEHIQIAMSQDGIWLKRSPDVTRCSTFWGKLLGENFSPKERLSARNFL